LLPDHVPPPMIPWREPQIFLLYGRIFQARCKFLKNFFLRLRSSYFFFVERLHSKCGFFFRRSVLSGLFCSPSRKAALASTSAFFQSAVSSFPLSFFQKCTRVNPIFDGSLSPPQFSVAPLPAKIPFCPALRFSPFFILFVVVD